MYVVFDLDGVLLDSESDLSWLRRALDGTLAELGLPRTEANRSRLFPASRGSLAAVAGAAGTSVDRVWAVRNRRYVESKLAAIESGEIGAFPDVDVVAELAPTHPLAVVSNSPQVVVDAALDRAGIADLFDVAVGRGTDLDDLDRLKPDPHLFERLHERADGDEYVYVGDEPTDRTFAEATGMAFVRLDRADGPVRTLADVRDAIAAMA